MKKNIKRIKACEPAPVDSIEVVDRGELYSALEIQYRECAEMCEAKIAALEEEVKKLEKLSRGFVIGGMAIVAFCALLINIGGK